jgi:hypothetical protein
MGATSSTPKHEFLECQNDYELVIKASKELEYILEHHFGATGKGLHEKISSASPFLPNPHIVKNMRYLATIRNQLVHQRGFDTIPDRHSFIALFRSSINELEEILEQRQKRQQRQQQTSSDTCQVS